MSVVPVFLHCCYVYANLTPKKRAANPPSPSGQHGRSNPRHPSPPGPYSSLGPTMPDPRGGCAGTARRGHLPGPEKRRGPRKETRGSRNYRIRQG
ncbi:hypothetical protein LIER_24061 [Lithospermum erythrorhizon]|uniref:Secreted protein n=1 Tax=Lithospermum erythrorhizon TaxID=34254 RepID=A0AAV3QZZ4_LITER